ncbi:MAG: TetR/AcrR family transcriptional regulator [Tannerella sp.]|jgi:AcrR family transcriptional regulator|nr:TetR/AcrR family transcriptional regulator [Tannerella sp.]
MPRVSVLTKDVVLNAAFEIVCKDSFAMLSARNVAKKIGSSVRPIYEAYANMDELKQDVVSKVKKELDSIIYGYRKTGRPFFDLGLGYIYAAYTKPVLFHAFYHEGMLGQNLDHLTPDNYVLQAMRQELGNIKMPDQMMIDVAVNAWMYTFGLASFVALGTLAYDEEKFLQRFTNIWNHMMKVAECYSNNIINN